jgi:hypothetical protein
MKPSRASGALLLVLVALFAGCAGPRLVDRRVPWIEEAAGGTEVRDLKLSSRGDGSEELTWSAAAGYHALASFFDALGRRQPAGCSVRFSFRVRDASGEPVVLDAEGAMIPGGRAARCVSWPRIVAALDALAERIPKRAWLIALAQDGDRLSADGSSYGDGDEPGRFAEALREAGAFRGVQLPEPSPTSAQGRPALSFRLELELAD